MPAPKPTNYVFCGQNGGATLRPAFRLFRKPSQVSGIFSQDIRNRFEDLRSVFVISSDHFVTLRSLSRDLRNHFQDLRSLFVTLRRFFLTLRNLFQDIRNRFEDLRSLFVTLGNAFETLSSGF